MMAGILSTAAMTATEIPSWKRWGIYGIFEWHENYIITKRLHRRFSNTIEKGAENHFKGIFFFHFLNGALAAIAFPYVITFQIPSFSFNILSFCLFGILYGFVLWIITLVIEQTVSPVNDLNNRGFLDNLRYDIKEYLRQTFYLMEI
ncbi:MAG: hypothetical protein WBE68_12410 [Candidatus Nitrosopolaris sp.]